VTKVSTDLASLKARLASVLGRTSPEENEYQIVSPMGTAFLACSAAGAATLLVPLDIAPSAASRRGGGFTLHAAGRVVFRAHERQWEQPAAILECTNPGLIEIFLVLIADLTDRLDSLPAPHWAAVLGWVEEWQDLLSRRPVMDSGRQLGLWGELWVVRNAADPGRLIEAWRGPDGDATDFLLDGIGLEVKASRRAHVHHVSQLQVDRPIGKHVAYLVSIWAAVDPAQGSSLPELVDDLIARLANPALLLKKLAHLGYSPVDREHYETRYMPLEAPAWFRIEDVPRVREFDPGISDLRYIVRLDVDRALPDSQAKDLWFHFWNLQP
jgi:putative PD-(D/E)XK family protein DUF4420